MKKSNLLILAAVVTGLGFGALATQGSTTAHAAVYTWITSKDYSANPPAYKVKVPGKSAYMWTWNHSRKLHNLKNYPRTTWYVQKSVKLRHNGKNRVYWQVQNASGKVSGLVWRRYFKPGGVSGTTSDTSTTTDTLAKDNAVVESQNNIIRSLFPGTIQNTKLDAECRTMVGWGNGTDTLTSDQIKSGIYIYPSDGLDSALIRSFMSRKIDYKTYISTDLKTQGIDPSQYAGWSIGVASYSSNEWDIEETTGAGNYAILLFPADFTF